MNWLNEKYNRAYSVKVRFESNELELNVFYNKSNLYTAFTIDQSIYEKAKRGNYTNLIFFDINKSIFCKTFLNTRNFYTNTMDVKNQFVNIMPHHRDIINCEFDETIILGKQKVTWNKIPQDNSISVRLFRLCLYENNFFYLIAERQLIDPVLHKKIVRTSAYQLGTSESTKYISGIAAKYNTQEVKKQTTEEALKTIFSDTQNNINTDDKLERCGIL